MKRPLAIDMFCGLFGWGGELASAGFDVIGFDLEDMGGQFGIPRPKHCHLVIQDVRTLHGAQFKDAALIVASPPCQRYSYMAMPWSRAKAQAAEIRADETGRKLAELNELFDACFRIQREACDAAGRHIPLIVENVRGAIPWVGPARGRFGSFMFWGDVPALMPKAVKAHKVPGFRFDGSGKSFQTASVNHSGTKQPGIGGQRSNGKGDAWFQDGAARHGSKSPARKAASAMIAKIPAPLAAHIAKTFHPEQTA